MIKTVNFENEYNNFCKTNSLKDGEKVNLCEFKRYLDKNNIKLDKLDFLKSLVKKGKNMNEQKNQVYKSNGILPIFSKISHDKSDYDESLIGSFKNTIMSVFRVTIPFFILIFIQELYKILPQDQFTGIINAIGIIIGLIVFLINYNNYSITNKRLMYTISIIATLFFVIFWFYNYIMGALLMLFFVATLISNFIAKDIIIDWNISNMKNNKQSFFIEIKRYNIYQKIILTILILANILAISIYV